MFILTNSPVKVLKATKCKIFQQKFQRLLSLSKPEIVMFTQIWVPNIQLLYD